MPDQDQILQVFQGTSKTLTVTITGTNVTTATAIVFTVMGRHGTAIISKSLDDDITQTSSTTFTVDIAADDTSSVDTGAYPWQAKLTNASSEPEITTTGLFIIHKALA